MWAAVPIHHARKRDAQAVKDGPKIDIDLFVDLCLGHRGHRSLVVDSGIVDQDVDLEGGENLPIRVRIRYVDDVRNAPNARSQRIQPCLVPADGVDLQPFPGETLDDRASDSSRCSRNQSHLVV